MKHPVIALISLVTLTALGGASWAVPGQINTQGVLWDPSGVPIDAASAQVTFRLFDAATAGAQLWSETQSLVVVGGVFDALIPTSAATPFPQPVQSRLDAGAPLWLSIQLAGQAELPRIPIVSVPYALHAGTSDVATIAHDLACSGCIDASDIDTTTFTAQSLGYSPGAGDVVSATSVGGAIAQISQILETLGDQIAAINQSVPYAVEAGTAGEADVAAVAHDVQCSGCVDAADIAASVFASTNITYAAGSGDVVNATTVFGAIDQLDTHVGNLETTMTSTQADVTALQSDVAAVAANIDGVGATVTDLQSTVTSIQSTVATLTAGAGVAVFANNGTTYLGKYLGTTTGAPSPSCATWVYLAADGSFVTLNASECSALGQPRIWYSDSSCSAVWGAQAGTEQAVTDGHGVYVTGTLRMHLSTMSCIAGSFQQGPSGNSATYCNAWSYQGGVCTFDAFQFYSVSGGNQYPNDNIGTFIASGIPAPRCGGTGPCKLK